MDFEWDPDKAATNRAKHGVHFGDVVAVFHDGQALTMPDPHPREERFVTIGADALGRLLVVVYTWRVDAIRIISARKATRRERHEYEGQT